MKAEILAVGTELLLGDILNTNAQYLSKQLAALGIGVYFQSVVGDNEERLYQAIENAYRHGADIIVTTGGLGPTADDLTKEVAARYFECPLVFHEETMNKIQDYFSRQCLTMKGGNQKQAYIPEGATVLPNDHGTAPGCMIEKNGKIIILLPGPPQETVPMFENYVIPLLSKRQEGVIVSRTLRLSGIGESAAAEDVRDLLEMENPTVAPYAKSNEVHLRITAREETEEKARALIDPVASEIYRRLGQHIYGEGKTTLADAVVDLITRKKLHISVAESCTGGLLTSALVDVPGASGVLKEGIVTYSNESKVFRLGVSEKTLDQCGAVSKECAQEMAKGIAGKTGGSIGISTTGIAGPEGGTTEKPVGLVFLGLCINGKTQIKELHLAGSRERIRNRAVSVALNWLRTELNKL